MRHTLEWNEAHGVYMCEVCGTAFTQDALIAEMDANGCPGPTAEEGNPSTGFRVTSSGIWEPGEYPSDLYKTDVSYSFTWHRPEASHERPAPYEDCEARGRRLLEDAGYACGDET